MASDPTLNPADWERLLQAALQRPVSVRYGRARTAVVRVLPSRSGGPLEVHLNAMFADAPREVQEALARWLRSGRRARKACTLLDTWIEERLARLHREQPRRLRPVTRGRHHDLDALAAELLEREFADTFEARGGPPRITWGSAARSRSRHSLRLGSYDYAARVVRVHRVLDSPDVPAWFVRYVLFHELLHAALEEPDSGGRRVMHGPRFRERERDYADFERARSWESRHIAGLIRSARRGPRPASPSKAPAALPAVGRSALRWAQGLLFG